MYNFVRSFSQITLVFLSVFVSFVGCTQSLEPSSPAFESGQKMESGQGRLEVELEVNLGVDKGQPLGTLFMIYDKSGSPRFGAGFSDSFGTHVRQNNRMLEFYVYNDSKVQLEKQTKPIKDCLWLNAFHRDGKLTYNCFPNRKVLLYSQKVNNKNLDFYTTHIVYDGQEIYRPELGLLSDQMYTLPSYYFSYGFLVVARVNEKGEMLYEAGRWSPGQLFRPSDSITVKEMPITFGSFDGAVLVGGGSGGIFKYDGQWEEVLPVPSDSSQFYSMIQYYDALLIGHWPSGSMFRYDGRNIEKVQNSPTPLSEFANGRELQTLQLYGGYLYAGLWPWGAFWRQSAEGDWALVGRLFKMPEVSNKLYTPYESRLSATTWGQRLLSFAINDGSMYVTTANLKGERVDGFEKLSAEEIGEYGALHKVTVPGSISAEILWKKSSKFKFRYADNEMQIYQDGVKIASGKLAFRPQKGVVAVKVGVGIYGKYGGEGIKIIEKKYF